MKPRILIYSDCPFFAGCENLIANLLNDETIKDTFSVSFAYNFSEKYEEGLNLRVSNSSYLKFPLKIINKVIYKKPLNSSLIWLTVHKSFFAFYLPVNKYFSIVINTFILFRFFVKHKAEILHINNGGYPASYSCYSAVIAGKMAGISRIIYVVNNLAEDYKHPFRWLDYPIDNLIKKWVTVFITGSIFAGVRLKKVLNLDEKKYITINNGIQRRAITLTTAEFKRKYSIPENKIMASVGANLEKRKGHIYLLEAILLIRNDIPKNSNIFFVFAGVGPEKNSLEKYIVENDLTEYVLMIDHIPDVFNLLNASDFVILPSIVNEDFPYIVIEAMSLGKPVIGTEIGGLPEQIEHNKTGIIVKPKSSEELKSAIIQLTSNKSLIQQFSIEAKKKFDSSFEISKIIKEYHSLYKSLL